MLVSSPYPLTGTACEAVLKGTMARTRWIGRGKAPRLLEGIDMNVTLEKHRHVKPGAQATVTLRAADAIPVGNDERGTRNDEKTMSSHRSSFIVHR
jgi:hypothetical protein